MDSVPDFSTTLARLPAVLGRYTVERELGRGAMGAVYLARDTQLDRFVALKIPQVSASGSVKLLKRFEIEARALASVDHPHICKIYDYGRWENMVYMALQFIDGEPFKEFLQKQSTLLTQEAAVRWVVQLASGLTAVHEQHVIHRDLKPANIMMRTNGELVIADFGLARRISTSDNAGLTQGIIVGTALYMAPEQAKSRTDAIDQRADIYALGTIFFELLTGTHPFSGSAVEVIGQKCVCDPPSPSAFRPALHPQVAAVCQRMIARLPELRIASCQEVIAALEAIDFDSHLIVETLDAPFPFPGDSRPGRSGLSGVSASTRMKRRPSSLRRNSLIPMIAATCGVFAAVAWLLFWQSPYGLVQIEVADPALVVRFNSDEITVENSGQEFKVVPTSRNTLQVRYDGVTVESATRELALRQNERQLLRVAVIDGVVAINGDKVSASANNPAALARGGVVAAAGPQPSSANEMPASPSPTTNAVSSDPIPAGETRMATVGGNATWKIINDELTTDAIGNAGFVFFGDPGWTDYDFTCEARKLSGPSGWAMIVRTPDDFSAAFFSRGLKGRQDCLETFTREDRFVVMQSEKAEPTLITHEDLLETDSWFAMRMVVRGKRLECYADDQLIFATNNLRFPSGRVGLRSLVHTAVSFRNIKVTDPTGKVLWSGVPTLPEHRPFSMSADPSTPKTEVTSLSDVARLAAARELDDEVFVNAVATSFNATPAPTSNLAPNLPAATETPPVVTEQQPLRVFSGHLARVRRVILSHDSRTLITGGDSLTRTLQGNTFVNHPGNDNTVRFWNAQTGQQTGIIDKDLGGWQVQGLSLSMDGRFLAVATGRPTSSFGNPTVTVWSLGNASRVAHFQLANPQYPWLPVFSRDGRSLLVGCADATVYEWNLQTRSNVKQQQLIQTDPQMRSTCFSVDRKLMAGAFGDGMIRLWSLNNGVFLQQFRGHTQAAQKLCFSTDEKWLLSAGADGTVRLWDVATGEQLKNFTHGGKALCAAFVHNSDRIVSGGDNRLAIMWDIQTGNQLQRFVGHSGEILDLDISRNGRLLATASDDGTARTWDIPHATASKNELPASDQ